MPTARSSLTTVLQYGQGNARRTHPFDRDWGIDCAHLEFAGAKVIRDNHIGDWGTQFGMLIWAIKTRQYDLEAPHENAIADLEQLYKEGHAAYKEGGETADAVRAELVKLQSGDPENVSIWERITQISWEAFSEIYEAFGIQFDHTYGESFYRDKVDHIYQSLQDCGLAQEDAGALIVLHPEHPRFRKQPFLVRKSDGASNYATTDLATILFRTEEFAADAMLYVVDSRQGDHFEQLFLTARKWYQAEGKAVPELTHIAFGTILGENGKPIKTKEGGSVKLRALMDEAVERSYRLVTEKNPDLEEEERRKIAQVVGLASIRYQDLSQNRSSDYVFSWERMLSLEGNTAPYLLYAAARIHSIFRKAGGPGSNGISPGEPFGTPEEIALARQLVLFPQALEQTLLEYRPHILCNYLFELAGSFSTFYNANRVVGEEEAVKNRRLLLCHRTLVILETGLGLLGIGTLEAM
jgi:arginyl-tRNA synthetase